MTGMNSKGGRFLHLLGDEDLQVKRVPGETPEPGSADTVLKVNVGASLLAQRWSPPANAGDAGWTPGLGRCHMMGGNQARAPQLLSLCPGSPAGQREKPSHRS